MEEGWNPAQVFHTLLVLIKSGEETEVGQSGQCSRSSHVIPTAENQAIQDSI